MQQHDLAERGPVTAGDGLHQALVDADAVPEQRLVPVDERRPGQGPAQQRDHAAKGGVPGLAREFAGHGITVNVVAPSYTRTPELDAALAAGRAPERFGQVLTDAIALIPAGGGAETDEVAAAVAFLAREDSRFITGQILSVNGGSSMS